MKEKEVKFMGNKDNIRNQIYLGALLHDIGKFWQRADENGTYNSKILDADIKNLESILCPSWKGQTSHKHVLWTAQFFKFMNQIKAITAYESDQLIKLAGSHHNPQSDRIPELIIQKADHYSSGADRSKHDEAWKDVEEENDKSWDSFRMIRMRSIFEAISLSNKEDEVWRANYKDQLSLESLSLSENFFKKDNEDKLPDYNQLWDAFITDFKLIANKKPRALNETLLYLLEKHTGRIPSSTQHLPDVSLYDHLKTTAAFAICLFDYLQEHVNVFPKSTDKPFLLIGGDLTGIQKYIYSIMARGAAKNLKGRSFYLQLLVDNIVKRLIEKLNLYSSNIIYSSGGGFYLIAPNTEFVKKEIKQFEEELAKQLFENHRTELYLCISFEEFGEEQIFYKQGNYQTIGEVWKNLSEKLGNKKSQKFKRLIVDNYSRFFEPSETGGTAVKDEIDNTEIIGKAKDLDGHIISSYNYDQIMLGQKLRQSKSWVISNEKIGNLEVKPFDPLGQKSYNYLIELDFIGEVTAYIREINSFNFKKGAQELIQGFTFYGGNQYPVDKEGKSLTFEELAGVEFIDNDKNEKLKSPGLVRIGVLRMDVDNLGTIFRKGMSPDKRSFSRYSTLSRILDYFFKGYLNEIWRSNKDFGKYTQIIYSGGDDLFIVGKWDITIQLAITINNKFREYTSHNPDLTLSGGMAIVYPKYPILKASILSETEEKNAKKHEFDKQLKNAFSFMGYALNWDKELGYVSELKEKIKGFLQKKKEGDKSALSQGFPSNMFNLLQKADIECKDGKYHIKNLKVIWFIAYSFKRALQRTRDEELQSFFRDWVANIFLGKLQELPDTKYHPLQLLTLAAKWAEFELR